MEHRTLLALGVAILPAGCAATAPEDGEPRILVFTRTEAFRHESIEPAVEAIRRLAEERGVAVRATEDPATFESDDLGHYAAILFLSTTGDVLDRAQEEALERYVRGGGGFAGVHSASDTEYDWPWYGRLVGAYFDGHPSNPGVRAGRLRITDDAHPATEGLPDPWLRTDEWYDLRDLQPDLTVLLEIDESSYKRPEEDPAPEPRPIAWFHRVEEGRAFYTALGHTVESWGERLFLAHVWGGIEMVMRGREGG